MSPHEGPASTNGFTGLAGCCSSRAASSFQELTKFEGLEVTAVRASATRCTAVALQPIWRATL